jgi:hypothetical protein
LRGWAATLAPIAAAYAVLAVWNAQHPGAITARFNAISITADHAPLLTVMNRFVGNYLTYFGPDFLFISGDHNPRHSTQFGGMLLWITLPLLLAGLAAAWEKRHQPFMRFLFLGLLTAPVSAALTEESVPHALRAAVTLPFLLVLCVEGIVLLRDHATAWRRGAYAVVALALAAQGALFTIDMYATWPARSAISFDWGELDAIQRASTMTGGTQLLLSVTLDQPYIQAAFLLRPSPPPAFVADSDGRQLTGMNMALIDPEHPPQRSGAIVVLSAFDPTPPGAQRLFDEVTPAAPFAFGASPPRYVTVVVCRLH